ncbi:MAG: DUF58 domain-containing protein [Polyangiales bacterium]
MIARARRLNFARLNHILIPTTAAERERWRASRAGRFFRPLGRFYEALTLEGQVAITLSMFLGALSLDVGGVDCHLLWAPLTAAQALSLVAARWYGLAGCTLDVALPQRVVAGEAVHFSVTLHNRTGRALHALRVDGPFLPWDGRWTGARAGLPTVAPGASATVTLAATFSHRGEHHLDPFRVGAVVPLGLAQGRAVHSSGSRFVVVPRVARVERVATPLGQRHQPGGVARMLQMGESMDLRGVRAYRPGDPVRDLHARSWARTGAPVVREYQQEYFRRVAVVVDTDGREVDADAFEAAVSLAAGLVSALSRDDALVDLLILGEEAHDLTPSRGSLDATLDLLACIEPGDAFDPEAVTALVAPFSARLSSALVVTCRWGDDRGALLDRVAALGVGVRAFLAGDGRAVLDGRVTAVDARAILSGERLAL